MYNNYNEEKSNNPKPLFTNEFQNSLGQINNTVNYQNNLTSVVEDVPPVLEPIKNLSDASLVSAPTMEVLDPMNIMPEGPIQVEPSKVDPLEAYDKGINYQPPIEEPIINNFVSPTELGSENPNSFLSNIPQVPSMTFEPPKIDNFEANTFPNENYEGFTSPIFNLNNEVSLEETKTDFKQESMNAAEYQTNSNSDFDTEINIQKDIQPTEEKIEESTYEIVQEPIKDVKENNMLDIGIVNNYDDIDMLEIDDVEEEKTEESEKHAIEENLEETEDTPLLADNVNEIRELINKIREKGIKIDFEEFDFEHMYQLIIKIEK